MTVARYIVILLAGSALSAQPTGPIRLAGPSPRIETLRREAKTGSAAVEAFWAQLAREHTPIVEPFPDDQNQALLTLVWRGDSQTKSVQVAGRQMENIPSTDVWYVTFAVASNHRLAYLFRIDDKPGKQPDPLNPNRFTAPVLQERPASAINTESVYMNSSIALVPKGTRSPWVDPQPRVAAGSIKESNYPSKIFGGARRVWIYHPPVDAGSLAGLLICLWGKDYLNEIPVPTILDNLLNQRRIFPLTAVFIDNDGDRFQSFQRTKQIADSLATELIPWIRSQDKLPADPRRTIIAGYSAAGLASAYAAFKYPELIGNVLSQSGAFWRGFEGEGASEYEWLAGQYSKMPKQQTRFFLHVGSREDRPAGGSGPVFKEANSRLRDVLVKRGYEVAYEEVKDADHEFMHWRGKFADGLLYLTSK